MELTATLRPNEQGKYFASSLYDTNSGEWYLPSIVPPPLPQEELIVLANHAAYLRHGMPQETVGHGKWKHRIARLHDRRAGRLKAQSVPVPLARPISIEKRRRARKIQRRCRECVTCVNDAFANGNGLGEALGPLSRCSKSGRDHPRRLLTAAASANSSIPAVDLNPDFDTAAFEDPYALITISPAYGLAPAAFTGPARGPDAITCAGPPADFTVAASVGPATTAPSYPPPIAFTSAPLNPLGADGYVTGPIVTCATYSPDGYAPGHTPSSGSASTGSGGSAQGGGGSHSNGGSAGGAPSKPNTVNPQDLILPNDISRAVTDPHLLIPSGRPVTGLGCLSDRTLSTWQCQHLSTRLSAKGDTLHVVCGQYCETERHLVEHYNRVHGPVNILLPGFWHPCDNCDAFGVRWKKCVSCGTEAEFADARWVCGSVGAGVTPPGHVIIGLAPPPPEDNPAAVDKIFKGLAPEVLATFGFPSVYCATLRPMYGSGYIFSRQFYSCLEDGKVEEVEDDDDE